MVPIIIVTAELGDEVRKSALEAHANSFINKPAKAFEMLETLNNLIPVF
jgi:CheY-like chemotaxis protein